MASRLHHGARFRTCVLFFLALLAWGIAGCGSSSSPKNDAVSGTSSLEYDAESRWFPLEVGSAWIYQGKLGEKDVGRKIFHCLRRQKDLFLVEEYAGSRMLSAGRLLPKPDGSWRYLGGEMGSRDPGESGALWLPGDLYEGRAWTLFEGSRARVVGQEAFQVPALGKVVEAFRVDYLLYGTQRPGESPDWYLHRSRWFLQGVGVVKEELPYRPEDWKTSFASKPLEAHQDDRVVLLLQSWKPGEKTEPVEE